MVKVPRGIEVLLKKARIDPPFRESLRQDPLGAAASIGLVLSPAERAILAAVPRDDLVSMAGRVEVPDEHHPVFLGKVAAAMLALMAGSTMLGCGPMAAAPTPGAQAGRNEPPGWSRVMTVAGAVLMHFGSAPSPDRTWPYDRGGEEE